MTGAPVAGTVTRRQALRTGILGALGAWGGPLLGFGRCVLRAADVGRTVTVSTRAVDLVLGTTVLDMLGLLTLDWTTLFRWQRDPGAFAEPQLRALEASGVDLFHPAVEVGAHDPVAQVTSWLIGWNHLLAQPSCSFRRVETPEALESLAKPDRIAVVVGFQNSTHFLRAADVEWFFQLGQRISQLTYNSANPLGYGCHEPLDRGLTRFGHEVLVAMNRVGMAIDVSHCGERTSLDAIESSRHPVLVTHANCRAIHPSQPRCKSDEVIRRLATRGGVIGMTVVKAFVGRNGTLADVLDHFEHAARLVGPEHVGIGSDTDYEANDPATGRPRPAYAIRGMDPRLRVFQIADGLLGRGFAAADVAGILGNNFRRVIAAIWPRLRQPETRAAVSDDGRDPFCPAPHRTGPPTAAEPPAGAAPARPATPAPGGGGLSSVY